MTISGISSQISNLQAIRAQNAFQHRPQKIKEECPEECHAEIVSASRALKPVQGDNQKIQEIRDFAHKNNITDIEEDDIYYAIKYGTSIFVDQTA